MNSKEEITMKNTISIEQIKKYTQMVEAAIGTAAYDMLALYREYRDDDTKKWGGNPYHYLYAISTYDWADEEAIRFYLKTINGIPYLYMDLDGEPADRYLLEGKAVALAFFGV
jgi:hypothetical protein